MNKNNDQNKPEFKTLTFKEINEDIENRVEKISKEFQEGFNFIKDHSKTVTFFGSARTPENEKSYQDAKSLAEKIVKELGYAVVTGGAIGIMEAGNRGAFEVGGESLGLNIKLPREQNMNKYMTDYMEFHYFFSRKVCLSFAAETYIYFPGGFGTLDELFEILTLVQTKKIDPVPIILYGAKYWNNLDKFIKENLLDSEKISPEDINLYQITEDQDKIIEIIKNSPIRCE